MNKIYKKNLFTKICIGIIAFFSFAITYGQAESDSLSLQNVLEKVIRENPKLKQAKGRIRIFESKIGLAKHFMVRNRTLCLSIFFEEGSRL